MNWVDAAMLAVVLLSALAGFLRGFARELLGLAAWVGAIVLASLYSPALLPAARGWIHDALVAEVICFAVLFVVVLITLSVLAGLASRLVRFSPLGGIDRILGAGFGIARGAALLVLAYIVLAFLLPPDNWPQPVREAEALRYLHAGARLVLAQAPERWRPNLPPLGDGAVPSSGPPAGQESF